jgi:hypothetical protein
MAGGKQMKMLFTHHALLRLARAGIIATFIGALCQVSNAQANTKRIILKDGSYQLATKWQLTGDRVRFFSAERNEWEEIPESLVDWTATNQYEKDRAAGKDTPEAVALDKEMEAARAEEEAKSPQVAPGLRLPPEGGVYALDTYLSQPELLPLDQTGGEVNRHTAHNVLRGVINPVSGSKHTIELSGPSAKVQVHAALPTIYINVDASADVRVEVKGDKRIVGAIKTTLYGKSSQEQEVVPATAEQFAQGWIKLTAKAPLQPGEYAIAELLGKQGMNSYVWDFGVHPGAPANLAVIKPEHPQAKPPGSESPTLEKKFLPTTVH